MGDPLDRETTTNWINAVFPADNPLTLVGFPAVAASGVFALGYGVALLGAEPYLSEWYPYVGAGGIFWTLLWLGWVDSVLVDVWNDVFPAFDVDGATYRDVIGARLAAFADDRTTLGYSVVFLLLYVCVLAFFVRPALLGEPVLNTIVQPELRARLGGYSLPRIVNYCLFGFVLVPALVTSVRGFAIHVAMLRDVATLPFQNVHTTARQLAPLVRFSVAPATAWFAGISLVLLWFRSGIRGYIALLTIGTLVLIGVLHIAAPLWILHEALQEAQQELLREIRADYAEIRRLIREENESPDELSLWMEVTDRRHENAKAISTWVYDVPSLSRLAAASVIPWLTFIERVVALAPSL